MLKIGDYFSVIRFWKSTICGIQASSSGHINNFNQNYEAQFGFDFSATKAIYGTMPI